MTIRYLTFGRSVALPNFSGKITATPPAGQFWIPRLVRVGVTFPSISFYPNNHQQFFCTLYHGGTGDIGVDAFVDGTGNGSGDVTEILNGTLIQTGEYLTADWNLLDFPSSGVPDTTGSGFMQIIGLTADSITEATDALGSAVPGPGFKSPLPNTMQIPQAPSASTLAIFGNPGAGNSIQLIAANPLYIYNVTISTFSTVPNTDGYLHPISPGSSSFKFAYYNPGTAAQEVPINWNFNGMRLDSGGVEFVQVGNAAANAVTYAVNIAYRAMAI